MLIFKDNAKPKLDIEEALPENKYRSTSSSTFLNIYNKAVHELKECKNKPTADIMDFVQRKVSITDNPSQLKNYRSASQNIHMQTHLRKNPTARRLSQPQNFPSSMSKNSLTRKL